jgi:hypothetical protein
LIEVWLDANGFSLIGGWLSLPIFTSISTSISISPPLNKLARLGRGLSLARTGSSTVRTVINTVELSSGTLNLLLKLSGQSNEPWAQDLKELLFWLEIASLSGEVSVAVAKRLRGSAENVIRFESQIDDSLNFNFIQKRVFFSSFRKLDWLSINYIRLGSDPETMRNLLRLKQRPDEGYFEILAHGAPKYIKFDGKSYKAREAFDILVREGLTFDKPIRLLCCKTGQSNTGFAQRFADLAGVDVIAPTTRVTIDEKTLNIVLDAKGTFRTFKPRTK